jgi:hypothetical protein
MKFELVENFLLLFDQACELGVYKMLILGSQVTFEGASERFTARIYLVKTAADKLCKHIAKQARSYNLATICNVTTLTLMPE